MLAGGFYSANLKNNMVSSKEVNLWVKKGGVFLNQPLNIAKFYTDTDIICLPSFREGISNILLEGGSYGCILLTSNVPGCIDVIKNNAGISFRAKSTKSLYEALVKTILLKPKEQEKIRRKCYERLERNFSKEKVIKDYLKIISF